MCTMSVTGDELRGAVYGRTIKTRTDREKDCVSYSCTGFAFIVIVNKLGVTSFRQYSFSVTSGKFEKRYRVQLSASVQGRGKPNVSCAAEGRDAGGTLENALWIFTCQISRWKKRTARDGLFVFDIFVFPVKVRRLQGDNGPRR